MITYLKGYVVEIEESSITLEVYGIGYEIFCSSRTISELSKQESPIKLYIYEHLKEDSHDLYGFYHKEDREIFKKLISVSGIGAKIGLQVLNLYSMGEIVDIILSGNAKALHEVSGIGPKTAQRILLELKDSVSKLAQIEQYNGQIIASQNLGAKYEAIQALEVLGYAHQEATRAVEAIYNDRLESEMLIRKALSLLAN